jgi:hypothetical protein
MDRIIALIGWKQLRQINERQAASVKGANESLLGCDIAVDRFA